MRRTCKTRASCYPQSSRGKKTIPLCIKHHGLVHNLKSFERADGHSENTKKGHDKNRVWDMFILYQILYIYDIQEDVHLIKQAAQNRFNIEYTEQNIKTLLLRLNEVDDTYLCLLFDKYIDSDLSHLWNEEDFELWTDLKFNRIAILVKEFESKNGQMDLFINARIKEDLEEIRKEFVLIKSSKEYISERICDR